MPRPRSCKRYDNLHYLSHQNGQQLTKWQAGAALLFIVAILGWYITFVIMAAEMGFPFNLPVGDLSHYWPKPKVADVEAGKND